nr:hypothetical protein [Sinorhizobium kostiense]
MRRHRQSTRSVLGAFLTVTALVATSALAQIATNSVDSHRCRVAPDVDTQQRAFAEKLDECNGVLKPPRVGDTEIVEPAPDLGKTRVIRPGELPPQQSGSGSR